MKAAVFSFIVLLVSGGRGKPLYIHAAGAGMLFYVPSWRTEQLHYTYGWRGYPEMKKNAWWEQPYGWLHLMNNWKVFLPCLRLWLCKYDAGIYAGYCWQSQLKAMKNWFIIASAYAEKNTASDAGGILYTIEIHLQFCSEAIAFIRQLQIRCFWKYRLFRSSRCQWQNIIYESMTIHKQIHWKTWKFSGWWWENHSDQGNATSILGSKIKAYNRR